MLRARRAAGVAALAALAAFVLNACDGPRAPRDEPCVRDVTPSPPPAGVTNCRLVADVTVRVTGAEAIDDAGRRGLRVTEFFRGKLPRAAWFASAGLESPVNLSEQLLYRIGFDVAPGTYRGAGRYELGAKRPEVEGLASPVTAKAFLEITSLDPARLGLFRYDILAEPCRADLTNMVTSGTLTCPRLEDPDGKAVSVTMSWRPAKR